MPTINFLSRGLHVINIPFVKRFVTGLTSALLTFCIANVAFAEPAQDPLFLSNPVVPLAMLNMTKDHQLYMKLYDDYSDLDKIPGLEITYKNSYSYYGYFDSKKCYVYNSNRFEPTKLVDKDKICNEDSWSGNFLNWATMTRMDAVRKILYGGYRSTDTTETVLERVFLPHDAHSFAKYYNGPDLKYLIPKAVLKDAPVGFANTSATGITICNTTHGSGLSQDVNTVTYPPLLRIAKGNYALWASNETWQCTWQEEKSVSNSNNAANSKIYAYATNPKKSDSQLGDGDYNVRVQVCKNDALKEDNCKLYSTNYLKPYGLLHKYGEKDPGTSKAKIYFGLITGSFSKNKSGGVVRKNISDMSDEIDSTTGIFNSTTGIVATLNKLRIRGYSYSSGGYTGSGSGEDNCTFGLKGFTDSNCTNWGNPQSEMYLQALRYFAGKVGADSFDTNDNTSATGILGLPKINISAASNYTTKTNWIDPLQDSTHPSNAKDEDINYCAPLNIIQFNASVSSYDNDQLDAFAQFSSDPLSSFTDAIGDATHENLYNKSYFVGNATASGANDKINLCTSKLVNALSKVSGTCPDAPHLLGTYNIAGLANYARTHDIRNDITGDQLVRTYGVELAPAIPSVDVDIPGSTKKVRILPACANHGVTGSDPEGNCGLVSFSVVSQDPPDGITNKGVLYVNWEAAEQGGDFDQDMWGVIKYSVTSTAVEIITDVFAQSSSRQLGFGYILRGTVDGDGFHAWSGTNGFTYPLDIPEEKIQQVGGKDVLPPKQCNGCKDTDPEHKETFSLSANTESAGFLNTPLYYAAKWGGYAKDFETAAQDKAAKEGVFYDDKYLQKQIFNRDPSSDSYFFATDPHTLQDALDKTFSNVANDKGSAASVATNSARLSEGNFIYQAQFRSGSWDGTIKGYKFTNDGSIDMASPLVSNLPTWSARKILIKKGALLDNFTWDNFPDQTLLKKSGETDLANAQKRFNWILGSPVDESSLSNVDGILRSRTFSITDDKKITTEVRNIIGDIVNSSPAYVGGFNYRYDSLANGGSSYAAYVTAKQSKEPRIFIGANDGMMHAFNATNLSEDFAYVATNTLSKLIKLSGTDYGKSSNPHQYLVDGPVITGDAYFKGSGESDIAWHSIVVGTLGAGGRGIYALDVTDPAKPKLMWELSNADLPDLGYVMGKPYLVPLRNGRWGIILGNGDTGSTTTSKLMIIDLESPLTKTTVINTTKGTGLSAPAVLVNAAGEAVSVYAGDVKGNLFQFNLDDQTPSNWTSKLLFVAVDSASKVQPITAAPTIGVNDKLDGKFMVYVGTGRYYDTGDNKASTSPVHSFYAISDTGTLATRSDLMAKTFVKMGQNRVVSTDNPDWSTKRGWYLDFSDTPGERITTKALLLQDKLIFPTLIPSATACDFGGKSWLMEVTAIGDKYVGVNVLPDISRSDHLILGDIGYGVVTTTEGAVLASTSKATLVKTKAKLQSGVFNRQSWRQIR